MNLTPERRVGQAPNVLQSLKAIITASCIRFYHFQHWIGTDMRNRAQSLTSVHTRLCMRHSLSQVINLLINGSIVVGVTLRSSEVRQE